MGRKKRWLRFGYASVNFGKPMSIKEFCTEEKIDFSNLEQNERMQKVEKLSHQIMEEIEEVVPVLPMALMCSVVLEEPEQWLSEFELKSRAAKRIDELQSKGAPINLPASAAEGVLNGALSMLEGRGFVDVDDGLLRLRSESADLVRYYANSISHW